MKLFDSVYYFLVCIMAHLRKGVNKIKELQEDKSLYITCII